MKHFVLFLFSLLAISSCKNDDPAQTLTLPSNLVVQVVTSTDGTGKVTVTATAEKTNFYTVFYGEGPTELGEKTTDGKASHTYSTNGDYTIKVQAHVTQAEFITESKSVSIVLSGTVVIPKTGATSPLLYTGKTLVWQDEFDGATLSTSNWKHELGNNNGWGNGELQSYRAENTQVKDGYLVITAKKESFQGSSYTSSRIITSGLKSFQYGRVDIRAALPKGQGIWPALWMLGSNIQTVSWPACGEIDIMEMIGGSGRENTVLGTAHWQDANNAHAQFSNSKTIATGQLGDEFHVYSIAWTSTSISWYLDNVQYHIIDITPAALSEFQKEFFFLFNIAVGGSLPGSPDSTTLFPQNLIVDYIRVFQ
jgi:Glycosyl hydrolases family 16